VSSPRILTVGNMYPPHHLGGAELIWHSWVQAARGRGCEVRVLTTDWKAPLPDASFDEDPDVHREFLWYWRNHDFPSMGFAERLGIERRARAVFERHVAEFEPDVVVWWSMGGMPLSLLSRPAEHGVPAVGVLLDEWLGYGPVVDGWQRMCRRLRLTGRALSGVTGIPGSVDLSTAAEWVFMSEMLRRRAAESGLEVGGSAVVHRGIDASRFAGAGVGARGEWGGHLLCLGRIDPRKGVAVAIRALAEPGLEDCVLEVVGDGDRDHLDDLLRLAISLGVDERVRFEQVPGERVPGVLALADALLFCVQWEEPWGLVPLEAMASGAPVIASGTGGSAEYLEDGANSLIYAPRADAAALAAAVRRLAGDADLRDRLREGGAETITRFSEQRFNDEVIAIVEEAAR
jgi:glycogen(starch) synthase